MGDQAKCDEVETQLKQDIENTRIRIAAETRAQIEKIEKLRKQTMKITDENLNLLSDVEKIGREYETEITKYLRRLESNQKFILLLNERVDLLKDQQFHNGDINADKNNLMSTYGHVE